MPGELARNDHWRLPKLVRGYVNDNVANGKPCVRPASPARGHIASVHTKEFDEISPKQLACGSAGTAGKSLKNELTWI